MKKYLKFILPALIILVIIILMLIFYPRNYSGSFKDIIINKYYKDLNQCNLRIEYYDDTINEFKEILLLDDNIDKANKVFQNISELKIKKVKYTPTSSDLYSIRVFNPKIKGFTIYVYDDKHIQVSSSTFNEFYEVTQSEIDIKNMSDFIELK